MSKDVIDNGELTVDLAAPEDGIEPGENRDFVLNTTAEAEVPGPVDVTVDLPEGYTVSAARWPGIGRSPAGRAVGDREGTGGHGGRRDEDHDLGIHSRRRQ